MAPTKPAKASTTTPPSSASDKRRGLLVLGNQLFDLKLVKELQVSHVFMREDAELCTYFRFHQQKIAFFLAAMRHYRDELSSAGLDVHYESLGEHEGHYEERLLSFVQRQKIKTLVLWEIEDHFFEKRILAACQKHGIELEVRTSPMFVTSRAEFEEYLSRQKRPFMKTFYEKQRVRLEVLLEPSGRPKGGQWSLDEFNREPLPNSVSLPGVAKIKHTSVIQGAIDDTRTHFGSHPGDAAELWLPPDRAGAIRWLDRFLSERFCEFGPYEDALSKRDDVLFHSVLSPMLNVGLLLPRHVIDRAIVAAERNKVPLSSVEGFVRQIIGWREFIRGIYHHFDERQASHNHFGHTRRLSDAWYTGETGIEPLDDVIDKVVRRGWAHHIERLMVVGNLMLLLRVHPHEAHRWFMEMFVDSSDWVMGPNVYGMALFSDGGIFATKPYVCGSNYLRKMGGYKKGPWCDAVDGLYWRFVLDHQEAFAKNPRMSMMVRAAQRLSPQRQEIIFAAASAASERLTVPGARRAST